MKKLSVYLLTIGLFLMGFSSSIVAQTNQYLHFDKIDDYVSLPGASQYIINNNQITMAGWFYTDAYAYGQGMMSFRSGSQGFYLIQLDNGILECRYLNSAGTLYEYVGPANTVIPGIWQHFAWVYNGSTVSLYVNGVLHGGVNAGGVLTDGNIEFTIGKCLLGTFNFVFGGRVDEVSVWSKALTAIELQDIMANELIGNETDLQLYYKFNQGSPGGNNSAITKLIDEVGSGTRDADLLNFAMTGTNSNFNGTLIVGYQAISFDGIPNKLISDAPFNLIASATSGLDVEFSIASGPATVFGNTVTLLGTEGQVVVVASQPGNATYNPAADLMQSFMVLDPATNLPNIDNRSPLEGVVYNPDLDKVLLSAFVDIDYPELFQVDEVYFLVDGISIYPTDYNNGYYTAWWQPLDFGTHTIDFIAGNNFGSQKTKSLQVEVLQNAVAQNIISFQDIWMNAGNPSETVFAELPVYTGAFSDIQATLTIDCPNGGCDPWDRISSIDARAHNGEWIEIIRYITPYGVACNHSTDLTDYMSILQGKVEFRVNCGTFGNGFLYKLNLNYQVGTPEHKFSSVRSIWWDAYEFGDYANLQPVPSISWAFSTQAVDAKMKIMTTGHGWGELNTSNAAEFYEATHVIKINGDEFDQHLWADCNPNPDGCQPQNGTWFYDRAGWCPGAISNVYDYSLSNYINTGAPISLQYRFYEDYVDLCHPNHPNCVTGVTCADCNDGYNPHLIVAANMITYYDSAFSEEPQINIPEWRNWEVKAYPNPSAGDFLLESNQALERAMVQIVNLQGQVIESFIWNGELRFMNMSGFAPGVYQLIINNGKERTAKRIIIY